MKETLRENSEEPVMKEVIEDPDGEGLNRFSPKPAIHVEKKDIFQSIARRKAKSISETSRQQKWSLTLRK